MEGRRKVARPSFSPPRNNPVTVRGHCDGRILGRGGVRAGGKGRNLSAVGHGVFRPEGDEEKPFSKIRKDNHIQYDGIDFGSEAKTFTANVSSANSGGTIELPLDSSTGKLIGSCTVNGTGGWDKWVNVSCNVSGASGTHDLYLVFKGSKSVYLFNLNYFQFSGSGATSGSSSSSSGSQPASSGSSYDFGLDEGDHINLPSGTWQSSDTSVIKINKNGKAMAIGAGTATLTSSSGKKFVIKVEE